MTRSEEVLRVGTREVESGRVRLRNWIETETVSVDVPVRREKLEVHREPVQGTTEDISEIAEQDVEITLREEQPVVEKKTVAKEHVSLHKGVETTTEQVAARSVRSRSRSTATTSAAPADPGPSTLRRYARRRRRSRGIGLPRGR